MAAQVDAFISKAKMVEDIYSRYVNPLVAQAFQAIQDSQSTHAPPAGTTGAPREHTAQVDHVKAVR